MNSNQLALEGCKITKGAALAASAGTAVNGAAADMAGYEGIFIVVRIETANAGNFLKAQQDTVSGMGTAADIAGSKVVTGTDAMLAILEIKRPTKRYIRGVVIRAGANTITGDMIYVQYGSTNRPETNTVATLVQALSLVSPAEGTP